MNSKLKKLIFYIADRDLQEVRCHYHLPPIDRGLLPCAPLKILQIPLDNIKNKERIVDAMKGGRYTGPCEAKLIMTNLQRVRCQIYSMRVKQEHEAMYSRQKANDALVEKLRKGIHGITCYQSRPQKNAIALVHEDHRKMRAKQTKDREEHECKVKQLREFPAVSEYSRAKLEEYWHRSVDDMYMEADWKCADWWCEYLHCVAATNPRRRPPTYVYPTGKEDLESYENKVMKGIDCHLRRKAFEEAGLDQHVNGNDDDTDRSQRAAQQGQGRGRRRWCKRAQSEDRSTTVGTHRPTSANK